MRRTRHIVLPVKSWQYMGLMVVSLACLTLGLVSRDRGGRSESLAGPELQHTAPHEVDACPNHHPFRWMSRYDETAFKKRPNDYSGDTRALVGVNTARKYIAEELPENIRSRLDKERSAIRNRRSIIAIDRRIHTTDTSRPRKDNAVRLSSEPSRIQEVRRKPSSLHGKRNGVNTLRSDRSDHRARKSNRRLGPVFVRSPDSRSREVREEPNSMVLRRKINDPSYRSSHNDQRNREATGFRTAHSRDQRLNSQSHDYRSNERRDNRVTRSLSYDRGSFERRLSDPDRTDRSNGALRRVVRSVNRHDRRDDQPSRISRSWNDRREQRTEYRRSSRTRRQSDFISKRTDAGRSAMRQIDQHERRERIIADRSSKPNSGIARTRSADGYRVNDGRVEIPSQNRRFVERLKKDSRRQENGRIAGVELQEKAAGDLSRSRVSRQSSHRNIDRSDIGGKRIRSTAQNSFARRTMNPIQHRTVPIDHQDVRRVEVRLGERRIVAQSDFAPNERRVRSIDHSERRLYRERQGIRLTDRSQTRRLMQEYEPNRLERRKKPLSARSEERRSSGSEVREPMTRLDSLRRVPARSERSATRFVSRDRQTSTVHLRQRRASSFDLSRLSSGSASNVIDSQRRERFALSDSSRGTRPGQAKRIVRTSNSGHRTSVMTQARQVSGMDSSERRSVRNSRNSRTRNTESFESVAVRDATDQRRARSAERAVTSRFGNPQERRAASTTKELGQTSGRISLYQNGRISAKSRMTRERRDVSDQRPVAREIQTSNARRGMFATRLERRQTSGVISSRRDSRRLETSKKADVELHERTAAPLVLHERRSRSAAITRDLGKSRAQDGVGTYRKDRNTVDNEIRLARNENNRRMFEKRSLMKSLTSVPDLTNIEKISGAKTNEYAQQILLLVLCAIYGTSLLKGKDGFYSLRNIVAPSGRIVVW